uniref:Late embryogenesis abundant protein LEA-2 subgroup domain-containing protein n=1 Tax=Leersia perrieri TaxID=77586 RepID=A0A0D9V3N5_9ORYZ
MSGESDGSGESGPPACGVAVIGGTLTLMVWVTVLMAPIINGPPDPNFSVRLVGVEGLDPRLPGPASPVFDIAVDVDSVSPRYQVCGGGHDDTMMRVSYHDIVLASALVPRFCIDGKMLEGCRADGVVVVKAKSAADSTIHDDLRNLIWTERNVLGKVNFNVNGNLGKVSVSAAFTVMVLWITAVGYFFVGTVQDIMHSRATPSFYLRIVGVEGLGLDPTSASSPGDHRAPPAFRLAVDVKGVGAGYAACLGGGWSSALRVSYHGMVLAWGEVPSFCVDGGQDGAGGSADGVATVHAKAESAVLLEEMHGMVRSEQRIMGKVVFEVEGYVAGLGYLRCKTPFFAGEHAGPMHSCEVRKADRRTPDLFLRLVGVEGLDPGGSSSPAFHLAIEVEQVQEGYQSCFGGDRLSMLHVSYHGIILAWGAVPNFCIDGKRLAQQWQSVVVTVDAKAERAVLREELRDLVWNERHIAGKVDFDVEGYVMGLGYLRCQTPFFEGNPTSTLYSCAISRAYIY